MLVVYAPSTVCGVFSERTVENGWTALLVVHPAATTIWITRIAAGNSETVQNSCLIGPAAGYDVIAVVLSII